MCFGCSKEQSHPDGSFEYPQHMFWLRNKVMHSYLGFWKGKVLCVTSVFLFYIFIECANIVCVQKLYYKYVFF